MSTINWVEHFTNGVEYNYKWNGVGEHSTNQILLRKLFKGAGLDGKDVTCNIVVIGKSRKVRFVFLKVVGMTYEEHYEMYRVIKKAQEVLDINIFNKKSD